MFCWGGRGVESQSLNINFLNLINLVFRHFYPFKRHSEPLPYRYSKLSWVEEGGAVVSFLSMEKQIPEGWAISPTPHTDQWVQVTWLRDHTFTSCSTGIFLSDLFEDCRFNYINTTDIMEMQSSRSHKNDVFLISKT